VHPNTSLVIVEEQTREGLSQSIKSSRLASRLSSDAEAGEVGRNKHVEETFCTVQAGQKA